MNWRRMNIKKNFIPVVAGALIILTVGTLYKSYRTVETKPKEKQD